jgi:hypothetical protein
MPELSPSATILPLLSATEWNQGLGNRYLSIASLMIVTSKYINIDLQNG